MENKLKTPNPPALSMQKKSQTISKSKPKIRIVHIIAPQIIKTDIENFRELVQRITGKPSSHEKHCKKKKKPIIASGIDHESTKGNSSSNFSGLSNDNPKLITQNMDLRNGESRERVKEEVELCSDEICGGYFGGFSEFISEAGEFPLSPLDGTQVQGFEL